MFSTKNEEEERSSLPLLPSYPYLRTALTENPAQDGIEVLKVLRVGVGVTQAAELRLAREHTVKKFRFYFKLNFLSHPDILATLFVATKN